MSKEQLVQEIFKHFGFRAEKIPECNEKTPDFIVKDSGLTFLVELKEKYDSPEFTQNRAQVLEKGDHFEHVEIMRRNNSISKRITQSYEQLRAQKNRYQADFCLIFLFAAGHYQSNQFGQFISTLYGSKFLVPIGPGAGTGKPCYYLGNSDFYRFRDVLDGAILSTERQLKFCVNILSENYAQLIASSLGRCFKDGTVDPRQREKDGIAYILDSSVNRESEEEIESYFREKYGIEKYTTFSQQVFSVEARVPVSDE